MSKTLRQCLYLSIILTLFLAQICPGQAQARVQGQTAQSGRAVSGQQKPNGISVGRPKVFDNRTLTIMLESLSNSLQNMQFVNRDALAAAFNFLQGSRSSEVVSNLSITPVPLPSLKQEDTRNTGLVSATGAPLPDTTTKKTTSDRAAVAPQAPALDNPPAFSGFNPTFGQNPSDLLNDQVNLTYQIFNLRMLLERSLSDRLLDDNEPRRQAVLGFNVTIDPPRTTNDAVAVVEITLNLDDGCDKPDCLSLVSLMPQEKTYNSAALNTKSNAYGGAAVVNMFQVGYSERRRGQIFYLYRDNDTISYERMDRENPKQVVFGWMFRPVLGRRSVSPGLRQLFAIVALPSGDKLGDESNNRPEQPSTLNARIKTYWKKYDKDTMTSFEEHDTNRASRFKNIFSFGLTKPELFGDRYTNTADYNAIVVRPTEDYQSGLRPELTGLSWRLIGQKSVIISARGNNFFSGTQVIIGDKSYASTADGLILKSNQAFDLTTGVDALINGKGSIIGRYGPAIPLLSAVNSSVPKNGIDILGGTLAPPAAGNRLLTIRMQNQEVEYVSDPSKKDGRRAIYKYPSEQTWGEPIVTVNGNLVPPPYDLNINEGIATLRATVPESLFTKGGGLVRVSYPFLPSQWTATHLVVADDTQYFQLTRLSSKSLLIHTTNTLGFTKDAEHSPPEPPPPNYCWKIVTGDNKPIPLRTKTCIFPDNAAKAPVNGKPIAEPTSIEVSTNAVIFNQGTDIPDKIIIVAPNGAVFPLDVPKLTPTPAAAPKPRELNQNDALWIDVAVKGVFSDVGLVEANQLALEFRESPTGEDGTPPKSIQVHVTRKITDKPGLVEITVLNKSGKPIGTTQLLIKTTPDKGEK